MTEPGRMHAGAPAPGPAVPEPTHAERVRTLLSLGRMGTLATVSRKHPGFPFGSVMPYALDASGRPLFLISSMAVHTHNVQAEPRASLLVQQPDATGDPLASARATLLGNVAVIPGEDRAAARELYLARYDNARYWVDFDDFAFYRLEPVDVYFVGGFGVMGWVAAADYLAAAPDPLADAALRIIEHMNTDHADALILLAGQASDWTIEEARMTAVDRLGFHVRMKTTAGMKGLRIGFPREVLDAGEARTVMVEMVQAARPAE